MRVRWKQLVSIALLAQPVFPASATDDPCNFTEERSPTFKGSSSFDFQGVAMNAPQQLFVEIIPQKDRSSGNVKLRVSVDVTDLKRILPIIMKQKAGIPASSCNDRYRDDGYFVNGTGVNRIDAGFTVHYAKWKCVSADVPCPTIAKPLRVCRKDASTEILHSDANINAQLSALITQSKDIDIHVSTSTKMSDVSAQLAFLGSLVGSLAGGGVTSIAGTVWGHAQGQQIKDRVEKMGTFSTDLAPPDQTSMKALKKLKFKLEDAHFSGTAPISLDIIYQSPPQQIKTACFIKNIAMQKGMPL